MSLMSWSRLSIASWRDSARRWRSLALPVSGSVYRTRAHQVTGHFLGPVLICSWSLLQSNRVKMESFGVMVSAFRVGSLKFHTHSHTQIFCPLVSVVVHRTAV